MFLYSEFQDVRLPELKWLRVDRRILLLEHVGSLADEVQCPELLGDHQVVS